MDVYRDLAYLQLSSSVLPEEDSVLPCVTGELILRINFARSLFQHANALGPGTRRRRPTTMPRAPKNTGEKDESDHLAYSSFRWATSDSHIP